MFALWLVGCHWFPPTTTSPTGMAGVILGPDGSPVVGLKVENLESSVPTDGEGRFGLYYKRPETYVVFEVDGMPYRRTYRPEDEGAVVTVRLPASRPLAVDCGPFTCALTLDWDLGDGLTARWDGRCEAGRPIDVSGAPPDAPRVSCRPKVTEPPAELVASLADGRLALGPPARALHVAVTGDDRPDDCVVTASGAVAERLDADTYTVTAMGDVWVGGVCGGRPALPVRVDASTERAEIAWFADGPALRAPPGMEHDQLVIGPDGEGAWSLHVQASPSGDFLLPPLPGGRYRVLLHAGEPAPVPVSGGGELPVGRLVGRRLASGQYAGSLLLAAERGDGVIQAEVDE